MADEPVSALSACTITTCDGYPAARVTAASFLEHHPGSRFVTLLVDAEQGEPAMVGLGVCGPSTIGVTDAELAMLATGYTADELCAVLRPRLIEWMLGVHGETVYLEPSTLVLDTIAAPVARALESDPLVLVPRVLRRLPDDGRRPTSPELRAAGVYDLGLLAARTGVEPFLRAWADHTRRAPGAAATFLDAAPGLVDHRVLRDPGIGVSAWNAHDRPIDTLLDGSSTVDGRPLRTVHLSGVDPTREWLLCADFPDRPRVLLSEHPVLDELRTRFVDEQLATSAPMPTVRCGQLADGTELPASLREVFREEWHAAIDDGRPPPPSTVDIVAFRTWASAPVDDLPGGRPRWPEAAAAGAGEVQEHDLRDQLGVSVVGHGPLADAVRLAASASGLPTSDAPVYPVLVCCGERAGLPGDRHVVTVGEEVAHGVDADEQWVVWNDERVADPVAHTMLLPVADPGERDEAARARARKALGLTDQVIFAVRVTPTATSSALTVVSAFRAAFGDRTDVGLLLAVSASTEPAGVERLRLIARGDVRIRVLTGRDGDALDATDWLVSSHRAEDPGAGRELLDLAHAAARGVPIIARGDGVAAEILDPGSAVLISDAIAGESEVDGLAQVLEELAGDPAVAVKLGSIARAHVLSTRSIAAGGEELRERVEQGYRAWRSRRVADRAEPARDPLQPLRSARHALLRQPDVDVGRRMPMAPALRRAVLRVLNHYDNHLRTMLRTMLDGVERTAEELVRRQDELSRTHSPTPAAPASAELAVIAERLDRIEERLAAGDPRTSSATRSADRALLTSESLRRVVVGQYERSVEEPPAQSTVVLCDAGLLRLPADDALLLPVLSSNGVAEPEIGDLIDSLIEPDGVFLDVGAHVGYHTIRILGRIGASGAVVAVEPAKDVAELLRHNVSVNLTESVAAHFALLETAAWDVHDAPLSVRSAVAGGWAVRHGDGETDTVAGVRLDRVLPDVPIAAGRRVSVVRVDIPGAGHRALGGMVRMLRRDRPNVVYTHDADAITDLGDDSAIALREFTTWGYELASLDGRALSVGELLTGRRTVWLRPTTRR